MTITITIIVCLILLGGLSFIIYHQWSERRVMKAREQQRLELTQNISHELKTPVASILGALETILLHPDMDSKQQRVSGACLPAGREVEQPGRGHLNAQQTRSQHPTV